MSDIYLSNTACLTSTEGGRDWVHLSTPEDFIPRERNPSEPSKTPAATGDNGVAALIAGSFSEQVVSIWSGERITEYLTVTNARRHIWHAWMSSDRTQFGIYNALSCELAYRHLTGAKGMDLIEQAFGHVPNGIRRILGRLGVQARLPAVYKSVVRVLQKDGPGAKLLRHTAEPSDKLILFLAELPNFLDVKPVLKLLTNDSIGIESIGFLSWSLKRVESLAGVAAATDIIASPKPMEKLWDVILSFPFPTPPWPGDDVLLPVTSPGHLHRIARELDVCLVDGIRRWDALTGVANGDRYFYEWCGSTPALLQFKRIGLLGWRLDEARARRNVDLPEEERDDILSRISSAENFCPLWSPRMPYEQIGTYNLEDLLL